MTPLASLPVDHPLRNTPLGEIDAKYKWVGAADKPGFRTVRVGAPKLIGCTYNQLGPSWTDHDIWYVD